MANDIFTTHIKKSDGTEETYNPDKVIVSVITVGVPYMDAVKVTDTVTRKVKKQDSLTSAELRELIKGIIATKYPEIAEKYAKNGMYIATESGLFELFDCKKIIQSLIKEVGMDEKDAKKIARQTEKRLRKINAKRLTPSLIRDTVCITLMENGFEDQRSKYTRVGMPVFDVTELIMNNDHDNANVQHNPETIHKHAADRVMKSYLFTILPAHLTKAHIRGDIHLHDADYYAVRPNCMQHELPWFFQNGLKVDGFGNHTSVSGPAKNHMVAVLHAAKVLASSQTNMAGGQSLDNFNTYIAPFLAGLTKDEIKQAAQCFIFEMNQLYVARGGQSVSYDAPLVIKTEKGVEVVEIGEFCHRYLDSDGTFMLPDEKAETLSLNRETGELEWKPVTGVYVHRPASKLHEVTLRTGKKVKITSDHSLFTLDERMNIVETKVGDEPGTILAVNHIPLPETHSDISIDEAWITGVLIGDGHVIYSNGYVTGVRMAGKNRAVIDRFKRIITEMGGNPREICNEFGVPEVHVTSRDIGMKFVEIGHGSENKCIPNTLLSAPEPIILALMDGLLSSDGSVNRGRYEYYTTSNTLRNQMEFILNRLGIRYAVRTRMEPSNFNRNFPVHCIQINPEGTQRLMTTNSDRIITYDDMLEENAGVEYNGCLDNHPHDFSIMRGFIKEYCGGAQYNLSYAFKTPQRRLKYEHIQMLKDAAPWIAKKMENILPMEVKGIVDAPMEEFVYDIGVKDNQNFVLANGIVAHNTVFSSVNLDFEIPSYLVNEPAIGRGGKVVGTYGDYLLELQAFTNAYLDVMLDGDAIGKPHLFPNTIFRVRDNTFNDDTQKQIMLKVCYLFSKYGTPYILNMLPDYQHEAVNAMGCRTRLSGDWADKHGYEDPRMSTERCGNLQYITINMPRVAYQAKGDEDRAKEILGDKLDLVFDATMFKRDLIKSRMEHGIFPFIAQTNKDGEQYYRFDDITLTAGFAGLNEMVQFIAGKQLHESPDIYKLGFDYVKYMREYMNDKSEQTGLRFTLTQSPAETTCGRFAKLDYLEFGDTAIVQGDKSNIDSLYYTNSSHMNVSANMPLYERAKLDGAFHPLCNGGHIAHIFLGEANPDPEGLLVLTEKLCKNTELGLFDYAKEVTTCDDCHTVVGGLHETCPKCGSAALEKYARITGYTQNVGGFNRAKVEEVKNRHKYTI